MSIAAAQFFAPDDADARLRALDPTASFIVQAPAGSGKTTLLVRRFLVLLSQATQPEAIVAITFTRKAAAEMRARIVEELNEGASESARAALDRDREGGWNLRANPARLRIQTIDSLCAAIVQRMPWMARTGGMPGIVEDARELYREAAERTLAHVARGGPAGRAAAQLLLHLDNDFRAVRGMIEELLARRDQWLRHVGIGSGGEALRSALEDSLGRLVAHGIEKAAGRIPPLVLSRIVELHDLAGQGDPIGALPATASQDLPPWRSIASLLLTSGDSWRKTVNASHGFPPNRKSEKQEFLDIVSSLAADELLLPALVDIRKLPEAHFREEQWRVLEALLTLLPVAAAELKLTFRDRDVVDFVELGEAARAALGPPDYPSDLSLSFGERIQHLLIDEFQDTSVSQFDLVQRLIAGWDGMDSRTLFLVGDPMQSIYRFREAEVGLFLRARSEGIGSLHCEPLRLTSNFRSRAPIVEWVNSAFSTIFPAAEDASLGAVTYASSHAARATAGDSGVVFHAFPSPDEQPEAEVVARLAQAAMTGSVAVLVRARAHATAILAELARKRIPFRAVEFNPLAERPAIQDLQALTRALMHPGDRASWLAVLRAPWCGLTLPELHDLAAPDPRAIIWDRITASGSPRILRLRDALAPSLRDARRVPLRQCVEPAWLRLGGPDCLTSPEDRADCDRFLDLLDEIDEGGEVSFGLLERRIEQLFGVTPPAEGPAVELMTIHKAKGLQWDTVIVPGLGRESAGDPKPLMRWSETPMPDGSTRLLLAPIEATREEEDDPIFAYLARLERQRGRYEEARLLYVAATRARENLHLLGHAEPNARGEPRPRAGTLLNLLWPLVQQEFTATVPLAAPSPVPPPLDQTIRRLPEDWRPGADDSSAPDWQPRDSTEIGTAIKPDTVIHHWMHRAALEGSTEPPSPASIRADLERLGLAEAELLHASETIERVLSRILADARGRWILGPHPEAATELRVSIQSGGVIHHATIDRTFVDEDGTRWIIDYGSDDSRLNLYARYFRATEDRPIRLGLYDPHSGDWHERPAD